MGISTHVYSARTNFTIRSYQEATFLAKHKKVTCRSQPGTCLKHQNLQDNSHWSTRQMSQYEFRRLFFCLKFTYWKRKVVPLQTNAAARYFQWFSLVIQNWALSQKIVRTHKYFKAFLAFSFPTLWFAIKFTLTLTSYRKKKLLCTCEN